MSKVDVTVSVSKGTYDLVRGIVAFVAGAKQAVADGWQPVQDVPALVTDAVKNLMPVVGDLAVVGSEFKEDPEASVTAVALACKGFVSVFAPKAV